MHAYALLDKVNAAFGSHQWALANVVDDANKDNFSTIWNNQRGECLLNHYDDAVYLYGGRKKIYELLSHYKFAKIKHAVSSHPDDRIYVFRAEFEVDGLPGFEKEKQILMFAVADSNRLAQLANLRDTDLDVDSFDKCYTGNDIRAKMRQKWPDRLR